MKVLVNIFRVLVGALFIFSGSVKAIDPLGTSYKMHDYFSSFIYDFPALKGLMEFMTEQSLALAVFMIVLEIILGVTLLLGYQNKWTTSLLLLIIAFFTFLTGYTYLSGYSFDGFFNFGSWAFDEKNMKVTDCGCFGDFIKLHPKESFIKDIVLGAMIILLFVKQNLIIPILKSKTAGLITAGATLLTLLFCMSNYVWGLPIVDFRPYKVGNHLPELMEVKKAPNVEYAFIYKNKASGESKSFGMSEISNLDKEQWEYVDRTENVIDPGIPATVINFLIENDLGEEMNNDILYNEDYSFMVVAYELSKTNTKAFVEKINPLAKAAESKQIEFYVVTNSDPETFRHEYQTMYPFYKGDATFLKTIIRSNPGVLLWKNGKVIAKWHYRNLPDFETINKQYGLRP